MIDKLDIYEDSKFNQVTAECEIALFSKGLTAWLVCTAIVVLKLPWHLFFIIVSIFIYYLTDTVLEEKLIVINSIGIQCITRRLLNQSKKEFILLADVSHVIINEVMTGQTFKHVLQVIYKMDGVEKIKVPFKDMSCSLEELKEIQHKLHAALDRPTHKKYDNSRGNSEVLAKDFENCSKPLASMMNDVRKVPQEELREKRYNLRKR